MRTQNTNATFLDGCIAVPASISSTRRHRRRRRTTRCFQRRTRIGLVDFRLVSASNTQQLRSNTAAPGFRLLETVSGTVAFVRRIVVHRPYRCGSKAARQAVPVLLHTLRHQL